MIETTEHHPRYLRRLRYAFEGYRTGYGDPVLLPIALLMARRVTGRVRFETTISCSPEVAHGLIKRAILSVCRTRVLAKYPEPIGAACYYGEFINLPLVITVRIDGDGPQTARIEATCESGGNTSAQVHERRRAELRKLVAFIEASA